MDELSASETCQQGMARADLSELQQPGLKIKDKLAREKHKKSFNGSFTWHKSLHKEMKARKNNESLSIFVLDLMKNGCRVDI